MTNEPNLVGQLVADVTRKAMTTKNLTQSYAHELIGLISKAKEQHPKSESDALAAIEQRALLYENAHAIAKGPALDKLLPGGGITQRLAVMREHDVEIVSAVVAREWAGIDVRDFCKLQDLYDQISAAVNIAHLARVNVAYGESLAATSSQVAEQVQVLDAKNNAKVVAKEDQKGCVTISTTFCGGSLALRSILASDVIDVDEHTQGIRPG